MNRRQKKRNMLVEINITPFTDVVLVLLIIFMISAPILMRTDNIKVILPEARKANRVEEGTKGISVNVTSTDDVFLDNAKYNLKNSMDEFRKRLGTVSKTAKNPSIVINGDKNCKYDSVVRVIDVANQLGIRQINLGVDLKGR